VKRTGSKAGRETGRWLKQEAAEQRRRYRGGVARQAALEPRRQRWMAQFLERIQAHGYHLHDAVLRKVRPEEIPPRPRRRFRVVS